MLRAWMQLILRPLEPLFWISWETCQEMKIQIFALNFDQSECSSYSNLKEKWRIQLSGRVIVKFGLISILNLRLMLERSHLGAAKP